MKLIITGAFVWKNNEKSARLEKSAGNLWNREKRERETITFPIVR